jgi:hypothetical protein
MCTSFSSGYAAAVIRIDSIICRCSSVSMPLYAVLLLLLLLATQV